MSSPVPTRRRVARIVLVAVAGVVALGGVTPAGAAPADCGVADVEVQFVCATYEAVAGRTASTADVAYWEPRLPAQRTFFVATVARSSEGRRLVVTRYFSRFYEVTPNEADHQFWDPLVTQPNGLRKLEAALLANQEGEGFVGIAFQAQIGRQPSDAEREYWGQRAEDTSRTKVAAELSNTLEVRRARVRGAYLNDLGYAPSSASREYWAERLRTGTSYLDFRIALRSGPDSYANPRSCYQAAAPQVAENCAF
jgi:hypothetical protein